MWRTLATVCAVLVLTNGQTTEVSQCINHAGELPINTYVAGCITPTCDLVSLEDTVIDIIFKAPYTMRSMRTVATAYLWILPVPYDLGEQSVTCNFLSNTYCPIVEGEVVQYTLRMYIEPSFPVGTLTTIEFRVEDDNRVPFLCLRVSVRIVAPASRASNSTLVIDQL